MSQQAQMSQAPPQTEPSMHPITGTGKSPACVGACCRQGTAGGQARVQLQGRRRLQPREAGTLARQLPPAHGHVSCRGPDRVCVGRRHWLVVLVLVVVAVVGGAGFVSHPPPATDAL